MQGFRIALVYLLILMLADRGRRVTSFLFSTGGRPKSALCTLKKHHLLQRSSPRHHRHQVHYCNTMRVSSLLPLQSDALPKRLDRKRLSLATPSPSSTKGENANHRLGRAAHATPPSTEVVELESEQDQVLQQPLSTNSSTAAAVVVLGGVLKPSERVQEEEKQEEDFNTGKEGMVSTMAGSIVSGVKKAAPSTVRVVERRDDGGLHIDGQGLLNLCILISAGLWAVHTIVTVDSSMWRGWTLQETLMRLPWDNWDSYEVGLMEHPIVTKTGINVIIYLIGDWLSQVNWGQEKDMPLWEFDLQRTLRNGLIGAFFGPLVHYYYDFSDWILPPNVGTNRPLKIVLDQSLYFVSKCAMYISLVSLLRGDSWEETQETVKGRLKGVVTTGWRFWPFVHVFTYFLIPPRHRVLWVNCVDLLWSSILAGMTSGTPPPEDAASLEAREKSEVETVGSAMSIVTAIDD